MDRAMVRAALLAMAALLWPGSAKAQQTGAPETGAQETPETGAQQLGGVGESCVKRSDCEAGLRCVGNTCTSVESPPAAAAAPPADAESRARCETNADCQAGSRCDDDRCVEAAGTGAWEDFELVNAHPFFGLSIGPAASGTWLFRAKQLDVDPAFFFAFRGGAYFGRVELALEVAPVTWIPRFDQDPNFSFLVSVGGLPEIDHHVYWPLRFGVGLSAVNTFNDQVLMQGRLDLLGVAFQYGHLLFEINLPSVRFHSEFDQYGLWGWLFNISGAYVI